MFLRISGLPLLHFLVPPFCHQGQFKLRKAPAFALVRGRCVGFSSGSSCCTMALLGPERTVQVKERIILSEKEEKIFRRLLDVTSHYDLRTELRVAGGWVRDKLLGKECYDIDIAVDNMLGKDFCEKVNEYFQFLGEEQHGISVIQSNPDQSKHLETARMRIFDSWIDFVNLRAETYAEDSRIPTMEFGTAEEDAKRRDLTINSLFYNINTNSVEDLTGRGMKDLKSGLIVTPLPPKETFLDDPLRVLRAIRFAARFDFVLVQDLKEAASDEDVKTALAKKISRERIGKEVDLMMSDKEPTKAMSYIYSLQLFDVVFTFPSKLIPSWDELHDVLVLAQVNRAEHSQQCGEEISKITRTIVFGHCVSHIDAAWRLLQSIEHPAFSDEQRRLYLYSSLFLPLRSMAYLDKKSKKVPAANYIIREALKLKASDAEMVSSIHRACEKFVELILLVGSDNLLETYKQKLHDEYLDIPLDSVIRVSAGLLLRQIKDYWRAALLLSTLIYPQQESDGSISIEAGELNRKKDIFQRVVDVIAQLDLDLVWNMKSHLNGTAIMGLLELKSGGPVVAEWQQRLVKWQLAYPNGTQEECERWMTAQFRAKRQKQESTA